MGEVNQADIFMCIPARTPGNKDELRTLKANVDRLLGHGHRAHLRLAQIEGNWHGVLALAALSFRHQPHRLRLRLTLSGRLGDGTLERSDERLGLREEDHYLHTHTGGGSVNSRAE
eukprot:scaffold88690_cov26-Tisochrysis_lutea.AAC.2